MPLDYVIKLCFTDDPWWENIPDEITFSPVSSFSFTSLKSDLAKPSGNARNDELRPSVNDFLDLSDESKTNFLEEKTPRHKENNAEQVKSPPRSPGQSLNGSIRIENNLKGAKLGINDQNFEVGHKVSKAGEAAAKNIGTIPRLYLDERSQKFDKNSRASQKGESSQKFDGGYQRSAEQNSWKSNTDENVRTYDNDFQDFDQTSWKSDSNSRKSENVENSQKFETNSKNFDEYKSENFQSNFPLNEWQQRDGLRTSRKEEDAALTIQRCYRGYKTRMQVGYSAVQKALEEKRAVMERQKKVSRTDYL